MTASGWVTVALFALAAVEFAVTAWLWRRAAVAWKQAWHLSEIAAGYWEARARSRDDLEIGLLFDVNGDSAAGHEDSSRGDQGAPGWNGKFHLRLVDDVGGRAVCGMKPRQWLGKGKPADWEICANCRRTVEAELAGRSPGGVRADQSGARATGAG